MFQTILVPLDGSPLAEHALPLAAGLARKSQGTLRLARVHRPPAVRDVMAPEDEAVRRCEQTYLDRTAARVRQVDHMPVTTALLDGPVAAALAEHALSVRADLIALTTHGRGPLTRFWLGSVADELLRHAPVPLLAHRPGDGAAPALGTAFRVRRILVPLDGTSGAEAALAPAAELARLFGAGLLLLRAVEPVPVVSPDGMTYLTPAGDGPFLDELTAQARADLGRLTDRLRAEGLPADARVVVHESPAAAVLEAASGADLIALATHGRGRVARFFLGSVADKVVRGAPCPVFVTRSHPHSGGPP
jgi:nucleotide-binding universal stress UspA family protein